MYRPLITRFLFVDCPRNVTGLKITPRASLHGGRLLDGTYTESQCREYCINETTCTAVDYNRDFKSCWKHDDEIDTNEEPQTQNCCNHYRKQRVCQCK